MKHKNNILKDKEYSFDFIKKIKIMYNDYLLNFDDKIRVKILLNYLDTGAPAELLDIFNTLIKDKYFESSLKFQSYLLGYNFVYEYKITNTEKIAIDILFLETDEDGNVVDIEEISDYEKFLYYEEKFMK